MQLIVKTFSLLKVLQIEMPLISSLKSSRTREKRALMREQDEADELLQTDLSDNLPENLKLSLSIGKVLLNLETKLKRLETANDKLAEAFGQGEDTEAAEQFQTTLDEESELTDNTITKISRLKLMKEELERRRRDRESESSSTRGLEQRVVQVQEQINRLQSAPSDTRLAGIWSQPTAEGPIKPPQLEIPMFDGNVLKWQEFWDAFEASIDKGKYSSVDKMNYLKSKLTKEALDAISGYQLSNSNYEVVVEVLKRRFGNAQLIIDAHYRSLAHLPAATNQSGKLRQCYDTMECHLRSLEALGENTEHRHFVALITEKLPQKVLYQLYMMKGEDPWTVAKLRELLGKHISAMEMAGGESQPPPLKTTHKPTNWDREFRNPHRVPRPTAGELLVGGSSNSGNSRPNLKCVYCGQNHWSDECTKYTSQRARMEKLKGSCFRCLQRGHMAKDCQRQRSCAHCGKNNHHRSLCPKLFANNEEKPPESGLQAVNTCGEVDATTAEEAAVVGGSHVLMQTATATISDTSGNQSMPIRMILDSGSQRTYITEKLAKNLKLKLSPIEKVTVATFGSDKVKLIKYRPTKLQISLRDGSLMPVEASVVPHITGKLSRIPLNTEDLTFLKNEGWEPKLADSLPTDSELTSVDLLIGNDYYFDLLMSKKMEFGGGLFLFQSKLGWILGGRYLTTTDPVSVPNLLVCTMGIAPTSMKPSTHMLNEVDLSLADKPNLDIFWNLESIGIIDSPSTSDDDKALEMFNNTVKFEDGRYLVTWPWKESHPSLPDNYQLAVGRLKSTLQRLKKDPHLLQMYSAIIQEQLERGIIEKVCSKSKQGVIQHYIPHHAVITPTKSTTKVRVVYDASAKTRQINKSLNECLYRGPVMLPDLCGLLIRFRMHTIAVVADVEKAFLSVGLQPQDRDVTRFLWLKNPKKVTVEGNLQVFRFCRIPFGVVSSPFLLGATIVHHLKQTNTSLATSLQRDIYVDNVVTGVQNLSEAKNLYTDAKALFANASMNLREWSSNSKKFSQFLAEEDRASGAICKVLGILWNCDSDTLTVSTTVGAKMKKVYTKREVLQVMASIFDPLGYFSPTVLMAKLFIQGLWKEKCEWDTTLSDEKLQKWELILESLECIPQHSIARNIILPDDSVEFTLLCFSDASSKAYAAAIYLYQASKTSAKVDLIFSKTRLASEHVTIPRLELLGILIGVRSLKFVEKEIGVPVTSKILWTDSQCVLQWMQSTKPLPVFVKNRLKEIKSLEGVDFRYVPTENNPADMATRGKPPQELSSIWWSGPHWLKQPKDQWPKWKLPETKPNETADTDKVFYEAKLVAGEGSCPKNRDLPDGIGNLINEQRISTLRKLLRVTAWLFRFTNKLMKRNMEDGPLTATELQRAKLVWDLYIQNKCYSEVIQSTKQGKRSDLGNKLNLMIDNDGLLRCKGRYDNVNLEETTKYPKLLPKGEHYIRLVIEDYHCKFLHSGVSQTLAHTRKEYWIPHGRSQVKKVLKHCRICRRTEGNPFKMPRMPPWPKERVNEALPFEYTGLDYFGPLYVKQRPDTSHQTVEKKVWVCLFTCLVVRAIHLEIVEDMSADQFLLCLRRFMARRGTPRQIISDNAKQFKLARKTLNKAQQETLQHNKIQDYVAGRGVQWTLIVELAPWMGGVYERLVGITKRVLRKTLGVSCL